MLHLKYIALNIARSLNQFNNPKSSCWDQPCIKNNPFCIHNRYCTAFHRVSTAEIQHTLSLSVHISREAQSFAPLLYSHTGFKVFPFLPFPFLSLHVHTGSHHRTHTKLLPSCALL